MSPRLDLARYIGDARAMALPLVTVGSGEPLHDWHYLLYLWGILPMDTEIAQCVTTTATVVLIVSVSWGAWVCYVMIADRKRGQLQAAKQ